MKARGERGVILLLLALVLLILMVLTSIALNPPYFRLQQTELQLASDSAAFDAASQLCSSTRCYDASLRAALEALNQSLLFRRANLSIQTDPSATAYQSGPGWVLNDASGKPVLRVRVERGRWWGNPLPEEVTAHPSGQPFETYETEKGAWWPAVYKDLAPYNEIGSWEVTHPQLAPPLLANAVYVRVEAEPRGLLFNMLSSDKKGAVAESFAMSGDIGTRNAAPFALHVCALQEADGSVELKGSCNVERFFTRQDRYCSSTSDDCRVIPGTLYRFGQAVTGFVCNSACQDSYDLFPWEPDGNFGEGDPVNIRKNFGVVGLPAARRGISEQIVRQVLQGGGYAAMQIGEPFAVLPRGLTEDLSEDVVWQAITGGKSGIDVSGRHIKGFIHRDNVSDRDLILNKMDLEAGVAMEHPWLWNTAGDGINPAIYWRVLQGARSNYYGLCNSRLFKIPALINPIFTLDGSDGCTPACSSERGTGNDDQVGCRMDSFANRLSSILRDDVVVAQTLNQPGTCYWSDNIIAQRVWRTPIPVIADVSAMDSTDTCATFTYDSDATYRVIGFIDTVLYDADIGSSSEVGSLAFTDGECNMVRGHTVCGDTLVPSISNNAIGRVHLVVAAPTPSPAS